MERKIFALINNLKGVNAEEQTVLEQLGCGVGSVCNVKEVVKTGDSFKVVCDVYTCEITLDGENVKLFKTFGDDVKLYNPLEEGSNEEQLQSTK